MAFNLQQYKANAGPVDVADIDFDSFRTYPLSPNALRAIRYMSDVETHTVCYLRDLLVTPSHQDPEVTTFLTMWNLEEFWHGETLDRVLAEHGRPTGDDHIIAVRKRLGWKDRLSPIKQSVAANVIGDDFIAVHMSWGAINEWAAFIAYKRLAEIEGNPVLSEILARIMRQETRHLAFYATQARDRLSASPRARKLTRFALKRFWGPVGSTIMPKSETSWILGYLLGGSEGTKAIRKIDSDIDELPGLAGMSLMRTAVSKYGVAA